MAKKLKQTDMFNKKPVPQMPEGYYSGDKPNPNLKKFVEEHIRENPYDPESDDYDVPPFDRPIQSTKATAIYNMHTYWSKKPHDAIREYIRHYTQPGDLVLDPFCGSGGTALAALMEGRKAIAIDRSPAATFITKNYCTPVDTDELQHAFEELKEKVKPEIDWLYETRCDRCGGKAATAYTVYSQVFQCPRCLEKIPLFDCVDAESRTAKGKEKKIKVCPHCFKKGIEEEIKTGSEKFGAKPVLVSYICEGNCKPKRDQRQYNDPDPKKKEYFETYDLGKLNEIEEKEIPYWYPTNRMMNAPEDKEKWGLLYRRQSANPRIVSDLFCNRSLWAMSCFLFNIKEIFLDMEHIKNSLLFVFHSNIFQGSVMQRYRDAGGGFSMGTYFMPPIWIERNQNGCLERKFVDIVNSLKFINKEISNPEIMISTKDCRYLDIQNCSVDYIFTDPPYSWKVQFGELNFVWESWLNFDTNWHDEEIIVNEVRGKTESEWSAMMLQAMKECYRVLKPGRCLSLCYHDTSEGTWEQVQNIMSEAGFVIENSDSTLFIDTGQKAWKQIVADKVSKRDLVINFRKPKPGESLSRISGTEDPATFNEKALHIIREFLEKHPGTTKDRIYDELVSSMVRSGDMEAHNFDELLQQVADNVQEHKKKNLFDFEEPDLFDSHLATRWYLKENEEGSEESEQVVTDEAAAKIEAFILRQTDEEYRKSEREWKKLNQEKIKHEEILRLSAEDKTELSKQEKAKHRKQLREIQTKIEKLETQRNEWSLHALHYTYISEFYFLLTPKPKITLFELLEDYFYQTDQGNWRPPLDEEEQSDRKQNRHQAARRKIKQFCNLIFKGESIPENTKPDDRTLSEWIRHCKKSGLYEQGKLLYEKGGLTLDNLPEEIMVNTEEDYQVCVRSLTRKGK